MSKRDYTHVKELLPQILQMKEEGQTHQAIADHFRLKNKDVVKGLLKR
ncbi:MAG: hypothetical protein R3Y07_09465 [Eubacteriales bacterium]